MVNTVIVAQQALVKILVNKGLAVQVELPKYAVTLKTVVEESVPNWQPKDHLGKMATSENQVEI